MSSDHTSEWVEGPHGVKDDPLNDTTLEASLKLDKGIEKSKENVVHGTTRHRHVDHGTTLTLSGTAVVPSNEMWVTDRDSGQPVCATGTNLIGSSDATPTDNDLGTQDNAYVDNKSLSCDVSVIMSWASWFFVATATTFTLVASLQVIVYAYNIDRSVITALIGILVAIVPNYSLQTIAMVVGIIIGLIALLGQ
jgi:hypothetical protein